MTTSSTSTTGQPATSAIPTANPTPASTASKATTASNIVAQHHPIIKLVIASVIIWSLAGHAESMWNTHEQKVFDSKNATLSAQVQANAQAATNSATALQKEQQAADQAQADQVRLEALLQQAVAAQQKQETIDKSLQPPELATRWATLAQIPAPVVDGQNNFSVPESSALTTVLKLEEIPTLQTQLQSMQTEKADDDTQIAAQSDVISSQETQIKGLQTQNADEIVACKAQINSAVSAQRVKDHKRESLLTKIAFVGGAILGGFVGHGL